MQRAPVYFEGGLDGKKKKKKKSSHSYLVLLPFLILLFFAVFQASVRILEYSYVGKTRNVKYVWE